VSGEPDLSIILVNFNDRPHLAACLASLQIATEELPAEVILVDNHSGDGSPEFVRESFSWVRLIRSDQNKGYAKANNIGIAASRGAFLLFLNTDTVVPPDAPAMLLAELKRRPRAGAIGPALVRQDSSYQVSFGKDPGFFAEFRQKFFLNPYYRLVLGQSRRPRRVGWLSGACLLARRDAVEAAGLFDENFFIYFEDIDLCRRLRDSGFDLIYYPAVKVLHFGAATTAARRWRSRLHYRRSQLYYYEKHGSRSSRRLLRILLRLDLIAMRLIRVRTPEDLALLEDLRAGLSGRR
jgi:GT2 family glycosyltransferase